MKNLNIEEYQTSKDHDGEIYTKHYQCRNLRNRSLKGYVLRNLDFTYSNLSGANLKGADLGGTCFRNANLAGADLSYANLSGVIFSGANLKGTKFDGAVLNDSTKFTD